MDEVIALYRSDPALEGSVRHFSVLVHGILLLVLALAQERSDIVSSPTAGNIQYSVYTVLYSLAASTTILCSKS